MNTYKKIPTVLFLLAFSSLSLAQNGMLSVVCDTLQNINSDNILLIYSKDLCNTGLIIKNDTSNFTYNGRILDAEHNEYIIFSSYSEAVGYNKYYLFDIEKCVFYSSQAILELEVPYIFSFNRSTLSMNLVSYDPLNCGKRSILRFELEKVQNYDRNYLNGLKVYLRVNL